MTEAGASTALRPRLLSLEQVQEACGGIGRDLALQLMHAAGPVRLGRRLLVRPEDLDAAIESCREARLKTA